MTAFHTIAVPHEDILAGRLTMDVFAADLWEVHKGRAPDEYGDAGRFFDKTYETEGLKHLLAVVRKRLRGEGGDPIIQIQTPFGGGKTHALIAMYHRAAEWEARPAVIVGTALGPTETIWGAIAEQLTGTREGFSDAAAPGREALRALLEKHQPVLILMDELLEYATKAAGVTVGETTLAAQTVAFLHELMETVSTLPEACLVLTLPSSVLEHYDETAERLFMQLQKVSGKVERIYTPVQEHEITQVIRRRLFASVAEKAMHEVVSQALDYVVAESLLPPGVEPSEYRQRFVASYPFLPDVVDVLYQRWGSFSTFQRTRGVLRLLSLVVHALKGSQLPYITLADFDLANQDIRRELLKHIGPEFDSVVAADITGEEAGAKKVDGQLGAAYRGLRLGTRVATSIFMHSFSGGVERGATLGEAKRNATTLNNPASVVAEALELLKNTYLFYIEHQSGKYFFTNEPNLTRIRQVREENIEPQEIEDEELAQLKAHVGGSRLKVFTWPVAHPDIPDTPELKLVLLPERDDAAMQTILKQKGTVPRVHCNAIFFLAAMPSERPVLQRLIRQRLALETIDGDKTLKLNAEQRKEVNNHLKKAPEGLGEAVRRAYRQLFVPAREGLRELDLGIPTYGESRTLDQEVYEKLRLEGEVLERIVPLVIKERYLREQDYVRTEQLAQAGSRTPGETRVVSSEAWERGIAEGARQGLFGLGELEGERPLCRYFKCREDPPVGLLGGEVIMRAELCQAQIQATEPGGVDSSAAAGVTMGEAGAVGAAPREAVSVPVAGPERRGVGGRQYVQLRFTIPKGKVAGLMGVMNLLQFKFDRLDVELRATHGLISDQEFEDKVHEAFRQLGIEFEEV